MRERFGTWVARWGTVFFIVAVIIIAGDLASDHLGFITHRLNKGAVEPWLPGVFYLSGIGLLFAALIAAAVEITAKSRIEAVADELTAKIKDLQPADPNDPNVRGFSADDAKGVLDAISGLLGSLKGLLGQVPAWLFLGVAAVGLIGIGSLYDQYEVFGMQIKAPADGIHATATDAAVQRAMTVDAAEANATMTALAATPAAVTPTP